MAQACLSRRLLRRMSFEDVKLVNAHFDQQPRKSKETMIGQIVRQVGQDLHNLVSDKGPFSLTQWNKLVTDGGGSPRKSFVDVAEEFEVNLDPVFDDFDGDIPIVELRDNKSDLRLLARKLGIDQKEIAERVKSVHGSMLLVNFVEGVRKFQSAQSLQSTSVLHSMCVASTMTEHESVEILSLKWMRGQILHADSISIAAGFYDADFLRALLKNHPTVQSVRLMFNGLGGYRLQTQRNELKELAKELEKGKRKIEIRLAFAPGMFHSKLFLINKSGITHALVGSANATTAAFERNEEILISLPDAGALVHYFEAAWANAESIDNLDVSARSLVAFFRTGILYFKPVATLATTLNPFSELLSQLTPAERVLLGGVELKHSELVTGIGPFSLRLAIQVPPVSEAGDAANEENGGDSEGQATRSSIKPWSVETCFGYWVPSALNIRWKNTLEEAGSIKERSWLAFRTALEKQSDEVLMQKYKEYLSGFEKSLKKLPNSESVIKKLKHDPFNLEIFEKFIDRVKKYLRDDDRIERLSRPFASGVMPEIWDDDIAYADFKESFSDYLLLIARQKTHQPAVPKAILSKLDCDKPQDGEELLEDFERYLVDRGWTDEDWK